MGIAAIFFTVLLSWVALLFAGTSYVTYRREKQIIEQKIDEQVMFYHEDSIPKQGWRQKIKEWIDRLSPVGEKIELLSDPQELELYLIQAGHPFGWRVKHLQGAKMVGGLFGLIFGFLYIFLGLPYGNIFIILFVFGGYLSPIWYVKQKAKKRQEKIRYDLPDYLDMMSITLKAGMGMDDAMGYYVDTTKGPLSEELNRLLQEIRFGVQREVAYRSLINRVDSPELEALIQALIQAHNLGTPVAQTFAQQAEEMRRMRSEQAKEKAGKAAPKISLVGGLVIAPSIVILIFGMVIIKNFLGPDSPIQGVLGG